MPEDKNVNEEKIVTTEDDGFEVEDASPTAGGTPLNASNGGINRPGGENKGRKSNEYWAEVEKELLAQAKELNKMKAEKLKTIPQKGNEHGPRL
jgi:hypothetical protein